MPVPKAIIDLLTSPVDLPVEAPAGRADRLGGPQHPVDPNWRYQLQAMEQNGYMGDPLEPSAFGQASLVGITPAEMIVQRNIGVRERHLDDQFEALGQPRRLNPAMRGSAVGADAPRVMSFEEQNLDPKLADLTLDPNAPYSLIPKQGDHDDIRVMTRRSEGLPGWQAHDFEGMTHAEAAGVIAEQMKARRIKALGEWSPDYIATLPVY